MLTEEIRAQVKAVLLARMIEDKAYRAVMAIHHATPREEADRRAEDFEKCARLVIREQHTLANMIIRETNQERELETR